MRLIFYLGHESLKFAYWIYTAGCMSKHKETWWICGHCGSLGHDKETCQNKYNPNAPALVKKAIQLRLEKKERDSRLAAAEECVSVTSEGNSFTTKPNLWTPMLRPPFMAFEAEWLASTNTNSDHRKNTSPAAWAGDSVTLLRDSKAFARNEESSELEQLRAHHAEVKKTKNELEETNKHLRKKILEMQGDIKNLLKENKALKEADKAMQEGSKALQKECKTLQEELQKEKNKALLSLQEKNKGIQVLNLVKAENKALKDRCCDRR
jgi:hypothetical protein